MGLAPIRSIAMSMLLLACGGDDDGGGSGDAPDQGDAAAGDVDGAITVDAGEGSKIIFVTSTTHNGDVNGPDGADGICGDRAGEADLEGTFKAWMSGATSASARLAHFDGPYRRTDGVKVADDWDDLTDGSLDAAISRDENGDGVADDAWTGTTAAGAADTARCEDFEDGTLGASGVCGSTTATNGQWSDRLVPGCNTALRLFCVQQ
ncbi:MAG TPA: hypothetical protein VMZ28_26135 [Kofleriaceae bacterium]|nr:hypothetical protein [Kofleriaceae bacterium]